MYEQKFYSTFVSLAIDKDDNAHFVFTRNAAQNNQLGSDLYYGFVQKNGTAEAYPIIFSGYNMYINDIIEPVAPKIFIDSKNLVHVLFINAGFPFSIYHGIKRGSDKNSWSLNIALADTSILGYDAALDKKDVFHIAYIADRSYPENHQATFYSNNSSSDFSNPIRVCPENISTFGGPAIIVGNDGTVHILYDVFGAVPFGMVGFRASYLDNSSGRFEKITDLKYNHGSMLFFNGSGELQMFYASSGENWCHDSFQNGKVHSRVIGPYRRWSILRKNEHELVFYISEWAGEELKSEADLYMFTMSYDMTRVYRGNANRDLPAAYALSQNHPNPFNSGTMIEYSIPKAGFVSLKVYDMLGRQMSVLVGEEKAPGSHQVLFDASQLIGGTYFYRIKAGVYTDTKKLVLIK